MAMRSHGRARAKEGDPLDGTCGREPVSAAWWAGEPEPRCEASLGARLGMAAGCWRRVPGAAGCDSGEVPSTGPWLLGLGRSRARLGCGKPSLRVDLDEGGAGRGSGSGARGRRE